MSDKVIGFAEARAHAASDARLWTPLEALKALVRDIESGKHNPQHLAIHYIEGDLDKGGGSYGYCIAGLSTTQHIALLEVARTDALKEWMA